MTMTHRVTTVGAPSTPLVNHLLRFAEIWRVEAFGEAGVKRRDELTPFRDATLRS